MIPSKVLEKIGEYEIVIDEGEPVKVKVVDDAEVLKVMCLYPSWPHDFVVGVDFKRITPSTKISTPARTSLSSHPPFYELLVLYWESEAPTLAAFENSTRCCLILHLHYYMIDYYTIQKSLRSILEVPHICYVTASSSDVYPPCFKWFQSIQASDLAARVLQNPDLYGLNLASLAIEVGVPDQNMNASCLNQGTYIEVETNYMRVFTPEQVKRFIHDAYTCQSVAMQLFKPFM